jgi:hypothetical protein
VVVEVDTAAESDDDAVAALEAESDVVAALVDPDTDASVDPDMDPPTPHPSSV